MKKYFLSIIFMLIVFLITGCTNIPTNENLDCNVCYTTNDKNNVIKSFCYSNGVETEITVDGFSEIVEVVYYENDMYCFGKKDSTYYAICCTSDEIKSVRLPQSMDIFSKICFINDTPMFMAFTEIEEKYEYDNEYFGPSSIFYSLDFDAGKYYEEMCSDYNNCSPLYYFSVSNKLVLFYAISDVNVSTGNSIVAPGVICYYDGKMNKIGSGFSPVAYNGNVVYKVIENNCEVTYEYNFDSNESTPSDIKYFSGTITPSNCFDIQPVCVNDIVFYADNYNIYYCKISENKYRKLKHFSKVIITDFDVY